MKPNSQLIEKRWILDDRPRQIMCEVKSCNLPAVSFLIRLEEGKIKSMTAHCKSDRTRFLNTGLFDQDTYAYQDIQYGYA